jgi:predicted negative regulator of RcsB-dependent stress response
MTETVRRRAAYKKITAVANIATAFGLLFTAAGVLVSTFNYWQQGDVDRLQRTSLLLTPTISSVDEDKQRAAFNKHFRERWQKHVTPLPEEKAVGEHPQHRHERR